MLTTPALYARLIAMHDSILFFQTTTSDAVAPAPQVRALKFILTLSPNRYYFLTKYVRYIDNGFGPWK